jgi:hypothetical protein
LGRKTSLAIAIRMAPPSYSLLKARQRIVKRRFGAGKKARSWVDAGGAIPGRTGDARMKRVTIR